MILRSYSLIDGAQYVQTNPRSAKPYAPPRASAFPAPRSPLFRLVDDLSAGVDLCACSRRTKPARHS